MLIPNIHSELIQYLKINSLNSIFYYTPLHFAPARLKFGRFNGNDKFTTTGSERRIRLPMYYGLSSKELVYVIDKIKKFKG